MNLFSFLTKKPVPSSATGSSVKSLDKVINDENKEVFFLFAKARCNVVTSKEVASEIKANSLAQKDILKVAEISGIMATKQTSKLIPLCKDTKFNYCKIKIDITDDGFIIDSYVESVNSTGIEMAALIACQISAASIYELCKSFDRTISITNLRIIEKNRRKSSSSTIDA